MDFMLGPPIWGELGVKLWDMSPKNYDWSDIFLNDLFLV